MVPVIDKNLFVYLTKRAGYDMEDVAELWGVPRSAVSKRLNGEVELRRKEMEDWMLLVGAADAGPVFFPAVVAQTQPGSAAAVGAANGS